ncbi:metalloregulator ArsR/SmtB family transcription factor [uncultured Nitrosomonas sp.]|uniref:ArsR/SmtB family transcription factor n=1 Tax=uncultured Nitrosomonas sp. TaxID=156424 RepID=UPI0026141093|nr:metalloregulator ArsR/SmtB family transcription factor [uncultured Nitrosomonas sp.]
MTDSYTQPDFSAMVEEKASAAKACSMLKILANEDRLLILCQLIQGKKNVGELEQTLGIRQPTLSQQLTVLRDEKLVSTERQGKYIYYSVASPEAVQIMNTLFNLYCQHELQLSPEDARDSNEPCHTNLFAGFGSLHPEKQS